MPRQPQKQDNFGQRKTPSAFPHEKCVEMIRSEAGTQFDPDVVDVFLLVEAEFRGVAGRFADPLEASAHAPAEGVTASAAKIPDHEFGSPPATEWPNSRPNESSIETAFDRDAPVEDTSTQEALV